MKILYFSRHYGAVTTTFIRNEVDFFRTEANCRYLCNEVASEYETDPLVQVLPFKEASILRKIRWVLWKKDLACWFYNPAYAARARQLVSTFQPDIIHCHFGYEALQLLDNIPFGNYPVIIHFHGYDATEMTRKKSYNRRLRKILTAPNVYPVSCNNFFVQLLSTKLALPDLGFEVLRYGIDLNKFNPGASRSNGHEKIFLQVSSLAEKKGHEFTISAFAKLVNANLEQEYRLILTGDGKRKQVLQDLAKSLGIESAVTFTGMVTPSEAAALMKTADVFVHHSIQSSNGDMEGIPNAIIEAMAMELPVVSTWHSGIPELVENGLNGYLVKEKDVEDYAVRMKQALELGRLTVNRNKVEQYYDREKHNAQLMNLYNKILVAE
ncbi:glycosyltransferase [Pseudobacter ginsenosidimutans]|uniref:Colanic acid/amylovoran biosynthesis glycosyltransferase n=1 Tax=Pseudobacter ginsenosidimutans TaxID=661488 RepID=A0A4Q7MYI7_9BACT|nr:glycosyltransferase [Pseudobacter ginsenosidimutans]QEC41039.1 colanic acid biosynthesis glycosyltransferase WcaL [Pseudobacter ginsenosidimutans]RZS72210.1 colanic acid/amylovoran biosynthesis glycosyltransferase [Pseudobacter ginsenosidimutans]